MTDIGCVGGTLVGDIFVFDLVSGWIIICTGVFIVDALVTVWTLLS